MAAGALLDLPVLLHAGPSGLSADLQEVVLAPALGVADVANAPVAGARGVVVPVISGQGPQGLYGPSFHDIWLNRIHVIPPTQDLGFVLSTSTFVVYVWNAYLSRAQILSSIPVTGTGGLTVDDVYGAPTHYAASQIRAYDVTVEASGGADIDNTVVFDFVGAADGTLEVTGHRVVPFPIEPNMREGIRERYGFLTDIIVCYDETEQRRQLREVPLRGISFNVTTLSAAESTYLESLVFGWQDRAFGVPLWWDSMPLLAIVTAGALNVQVDTVGRDFEVGGLFMLWRGPHEWEVLTIVTVNAGSLDCATQVQSGWAVAGTLVIPLRLARLPIEVTIRRPSVDVAEADLDFDIEAYLL